MKILTKLTSIFLSATLVLSILFTAIPCVSAAESNGFIYSEQNGELIITGYNGDDTDIIIPSEIDGKNVVALDNKAFYKHIKLKSLEIPSSVKTIGSKIVNDFENEVFEKLTLSEGLENVGVMAFYGCEALKNVKIPKSVKNISSSSFGIIDSINEIDLVTNGFVLDCYEGTAGENYAKENNLNYRLSDNNPDIVHQSVANAILYDKGENKISGTADLTYRYYNNEKR